MSSVAGSVASAADRELPDALLGTCGLDEPMHMSSQEQDWKTVNTKLSEPDMGNTSCFVSTDIFGENLMNIPPDRYNTMDAASKCFETIERDGNELLTSEIDGGTWVFVASCVAQIPPMINDALYFFHMLQISLTNLKHFAVPTNRVSLRRQRGDKRSISDMLWHRQVECSEGSSQSIGNTPLDKTRMLAEMFRITDEESTVPVKIAPFKLKVGFTGALYTHAGVQERKMFCVLAVTWARNFDILGYIREVVLREPAKASPQYKQRLGEFQRLSHIWTTLSNVAADNLEVPRMALGALRDHGENRTGPLGVDTLFNMFMIPMQIHGIVKRDVHNRLRRDNPELRVGDISIENLQIVGMPTLSFMSDEVTLDYTRYMQNHVICMGADHQTLSKYIRQHYKPKPKEKKGEEEPEDPDALDARVDTFVLPCPGGWPWESVTRDDEQVVYTKWGLPRLPLWLSFAPMNVPDATLSKEAWLVFIGDMPALVKTCLRSFLVQDLDISREIQDQMWSYFLNDPRPIRASLILNQYYSENADPLAGILIPGRMRPWWIGLKMSLDAQRERNMGIVQASDGLNRYLQGSILFHRSSISGGAYGSTRIEQALEVLETINMGRACRGPDPHSIESFLAFLNRTMSRNRRHDLYARASEGFYKGFEELNKNFMMNSNNLEFMLEIMISQIMWKMSSNNEDIAGYFQCIQQMSGNGHFVMTTPNGSWTDKRKPNSTGNDWTVARLVELIQYMMDEAGFPDVQNNLQGLTNLMGATPASIVLATTVTYMAGQVIQIPDKMRVDADMVMNEMRGGVIMDDVIRNIVPRNKEEQKQAFMNSADPLNNNVRGQMNRKKINHICIATMASNVPDMKPEEAERTKTLLLVTPTMPPGAPPAEKRQKTGHVNHMTTSVYGGRGLKPQNNKGFAHFLVLTQMWSITIPVLMNRSGFVPFKKSPVSCAFLDWVLMYIQEYGEGIVGKTVCESFKRLTEGYEARQVVKAQWTKSIAYLSTCPTEEEATIRVLKSMLTNALPIQEVVPAAHCFLTRGVNMAALLMISCIAQHLSVPILSISSLRTFFDSTEVPESGDALDTYNAIRGWLLLCIEKRRFCPETQTTSNSYETMSPYVSSDGGQDGLPASLGDALLRLNKSSVPHEVHHAVGKIIKDVWGGTLFKHSGMGPEACIYSNAIMDLMTVWAPDFRRIISDNVFNSAKMMTKMGLERQVHGIADWPERMDKPPPFARPFKFSRGEEVIGVAVGVHWANLLLCVAMMGGPTIHAKVSSDFSRNFLLEILRHSPPCATPGDNIPVRSFNLHTTAVERIIIPRGIPRPGHFLRPVYDSYFAETGVYAKTRAIGRFAPEDCMHCGFLFEYAKVLSCDILELPASVTLPEYELLPNESYPIWNPQTSCYGSLNVELATNRVLIRFTTNDQGDEEEDDLPIEQWQDQLASAGFIVPPIVFRQGAAVTTSEGGDKIGVIVPFEEGGSKNFDGVNYCYHVLQEPEVRPRRVGFVKALQRLVPLGAEVYVDLKSDGVKSMGLRMARLDAEKDLLKGRITVPPMSHPPPGKVYVTFVVKPMLATNSTFSRDCTTVGFDPWDLSLVAGEQQSVVAHLLS